MMPISGVSNSHRNTFAPAGLLILHNLPGSTMDCLLAASHGSIKATFPSAGVSGSVRRCTVLLQVHIV